MFEEIVPLEPVHFFAFQFDCHQVRSDKLDKRHFLADLSSFHGKETPFAKIALGWHDKGIYCEVHIERAFDHPQFPKITEGDSIELFFDTRDVKTTGFATRFCHHFFFLPVSVQTSEGDVVHAGEISRFRSEGTHPLCDSSLLIVTTKKEKKKCILNIFIPLECLHGYDPTQFDRLGFSYRINRVNDTAQHFSANSADFSIENQPSLWASLKLVKN
jgi:hypothetical protein